jgi:hypothetical protein
MNSEKRCLIQVESGFSWHKNQKVGKVYNETGYEYDDTHNVGACFEPFSFFVDVSIENRDSIE